MGAPIHPRSIVILDCGGQYAHLIGNRVRRLGAFSEIREAETPAEELKDATGIILSGGPQSVYEKGSPQGDPNIFKLGIPILGICYGHQWIAHVLGGEVRPGGTKEYGHASIRIRNHESGIMKELPSELSVWMSHGDTVSKLPPGFATTASSPDCENAAMEDTKRKIFGVQFHLEVTHTPKGMEILGNFVKLCSPAPWSIEDFASHIGEQVKREVGHRSVFMLVSGGVDSTVAFALLEKTLGKDRVYGLLVDTGLMRKGEVHQIRSALSRLNLDNLHVEDASEEFFRNLEGVYDPEEKRRIIGRTFLDVQQRVVKKLGLSSEATSYQLPATSWLLGQGTIYPDTIETGGTKHADTIKTHHNRVEEIRKMMEEGRVVEPLKDLYKDEVRKLGELLGLPHELVWRHPFPGPGLAVRILCAHEKSELRNAKCEIPVPYSVLPIRSVGVQGDGRTYRHAIVLFPDIPLLGYSDTRWNELWRLATDIPNTHRDFNRVLLCTSHSEPEPQPEPFTFTPSFVTRERADLLREADAIIDEEVRKAGLYESIWQFPVILLPVGIKSGGQSIVLRPVDSTEAMTANATRLPKEFLDTVTKRLLKLHGIDLVFYDLTSKPPATIEWE